MVRGLQRLTVGVTKGYLRIWLNCQRVFPTTSSDQYIVTNCIYMAEKSTEGIWRRAGFRVVTETKGAKWSTSQGGIVGAPKAMGDTKHSQEILLSAGWTIAVPIWRVHSGSLVLMSARGFAALMGPNFTRIRGWHYSLRWMGLQKVRPSNWWLWPPELPQSTHTDYPLQSFRRYLQCFIPDLLLRTLIHNTFLSVAA